MISCRFMQQGSIYTFYSCTINVHYWSSLTWPWRSERMKQANNILERYLIFEGFRIFHRHVLIMDQRPTYRAKIRRVPQTCSLHASLTSKTLRVISGPEIHNAALCLRTYSVIYWSQWCLNLPPVVINISTVFDKDSASFTQVTPWITSLQTG